MTYLGVDEVCVGHERAVVGQAGGAVERVPVARQRVQRAQQAQRGQRGVAHVARVGRARAAQRRAAHHHHQRGHARRDHALCNYKDQRKNLLNTLYSLVSKYL